MSVDSGIELIPSVCSSLCRCLVDRPPRFHRRLRGIGQALRSDGADKQLRPVGVMGWETISKPFKKLFKMTVLWFSGIIASELVVTENLARAKLILNKIVRGTIEILIKVLGKNEIKKIVWGKNELI